jgi:hypothetical protein
VFTARYALSPYIKQIRFVFKGLIQWVLTCRLNNPRAYYNSNYHIVLYVILFYCVVILIVITALYGQNSVLYDLCWELRVMWLNTCYVKYACNVTNRVGLAVTCIVSYLLHSVVMWRTRQRSNLRPLVGKTARVATVRWCARICTACRLT